MPVLVGDLDSSPVGYARSRSSGSCVRTGAEGPAGSPGCPAASRHPRAAPRSPWTRACAAPASGLPDHPLEDWRRIPAISSQVVAIPWPKLLLGEGAPYRRPSLSIANRLGNPDAQQMRPPGFIGGAVWYIVSALRAYTRDDGHFRQGSGCARPQLPASRPARQESLGGAQERGGTAGPC